MIELLQPCPFCGAGDTKIKENGKVWTGQGWSTPASVSIQHWCERVEGQPSRMVERVGRDRYSAIDAWNQRPDEVKQMEKEARAWRTLLANARSTDVASFAVGTVAIPNSIPSHPFKPVFNDRYEAGYGSYIVKCASFQWAAVPGQETLLDALLNMREEKA